MGNDSILTGKLLNVAGIPLSLDDIQHTILKQNYDGNPLIIYGIYQGIIGAPNIRKEAYTGANVYLALESNAVEFINSNRGTSSKNERVFRVSSFYDRNKIYFPDFNSDLSTHLLVFMDGPEREGLQSATLLKPDIDNWKVTDFGGFQQWHSWNRRENIINPIHPYNPASGSRGTIQTAQRSGG